MKVLIRISDNVVMAVGNIVYQPEYHKYREVDIRQGIDEVGLRLISGDVAIPVEIVGDITDSSALNKLLRIKYKYTTLNGWELNEEHIAVVDTEKKVMDIYTQTLDMQSQHLALRNLLLEIKADLKLLKDKVGV